LRDTNRLSATMAGGGGPARTAAARVAVGGGVDGQTRAPGSDAPPTLAGPATALRRRGGLLRRQHADLRRHPLSDLPAHAFVPRRRPAQPGRAGGPAPD